MKIWECLCNCNQTTYVSTNNLKSGHTQSCGCLQSAIILKYQLIKRESRIGERHGRLIIIKISNNKYRDKEYLYICQCDCGEIIEALYSNLISKNTQSCGCWNNEVKKLRIGNKHHNYNLDREYIRKSKIFRRFISSNLHKYLNKFKIKKSKHTREYYSFQDKQFFKHFDKQLKELKKQWKDIGPKLVFEHKLPISFWHKNGFDKDEDILYINDLINLQLITKKENGIKHNNIYKKLCLKTINQFIKKYPKEKRLLKLKAKLLCQ